MLNKQDILKNLHEFNYFIDEVTLGNFIKNWKIDAIYEDEDGIEFYDNLAVAKLKKGISLKSQGYTNDQITYHVNKLLPEKLAAQEDKKVKEKKEVTIAKPSSGELQNLTIDVTSQTLQMLADAVAGKIISGIQGQMQDSGFISQLIEGSTLKHNNETLTKQVDELMEDNKKLAKRVEELELSRKRSPINLEFFKNLFN